MGYSEIYCHICGVSFNVGRIRTRNEPREAAWSGEAGHRPGSFIEHTDWGTDESQCNRGCMITERTDNPWYESAERDPERGLWPYEDESQDADPDYAPDEGDDNDTEPYEYSTPRESEDETMDSDDSDIYVDMTEGPLPCEDSKSEILYRQFDQSFGLGSLQEEFHPLFPNGPEVSEEGEFGGTDRSFEHIAGPNCAHGDGYNGHRISAQEMRGCCTAQCLVPKPTANSTWQATFRPDPDDEPFERDPDFGFFLSGLTDYMPSRDEGGPTVYPPRHGCPNPPAENCLWDTDDADRIAMPFHPTCLEVYKRCSLLRFGVIDMKGLTDWFSLEADYDQFTQFPRDPAVTREQAQWWRHEAGNEWIAANPCFVPSLEPLLQAAAARGSHDAADYHRGAFNFDGASNVIETQATDPFARLPTELHMHILSYLGSRDIAALRLVTRTLRQLPQSLFHALLLREQPWLWEAWCTLPYAFWATTRGVELEAQDAKRAEEKKQRERAIEILVEEGQPNGENQAAVHAVRADITRQEEEQKTGRQPRDAPLLTKARTDWLGLYRDLARNKAEPRGLRNRRRIWKDCEEILDRIERHRAEGNNTWH